MNLDMLGSSTAGRGINVYREHTPMPHGTGHSGLMVSRLTIRGRLTLWYTALFAVTGAAVLTLMYLLVRRAFFVAGDAAMISLYGSVDVAGYDSGDDPADQQFVYFQQATSTARGDALHTIVLQTGAAFAGLAAVSLVLCWLVARRALHPLRHITDTAAALSQDTLLDARIGLRGPRDEVGTLAGAFDAMLDRLGRVFQGQRLFVANASHELRTPLTIIRTAAEMTLSRPSRPEEEYRQALETIAAAAARSDAMLTSLLRLAQTQRDVEPEPADLATLGAAAVAAWPADAPPVHQRLASAPCDVDPVQLELLLRNLLENAARYNVDSGAVWLSTGRDADGSWLRVENTGPVVDPADVPALRRAFQRGEGRSAGAAGAGLGLAIVDAVAAAHGAVWSVTPRDGGGLSVTVTFPAR
jgi:signal transduction histidine kinase